MDNLSQKNIIIFGATGFIGQYLTTTLANTGAKLIIHGKSDEKVKRNYLDLPHLEIKI